VDVDQRLKNFPMSDKQLHLIYSKGAYESDYFHCGIHYTKYTCTICCIHVAHLEYTRSLSINVFKNKILERIQNGKWGTDADSMNSMNQGTC
jgi:hypothetical protein